MRKVLLIGIVIGSIFICACGKTNEFEETSAEILDFQSENISSDSDESSLEVDEESEDVEESEKYDITLCAYDVINLEEIICSGVSVSIYNEKWESKETTSEDGKIHIMLEEGKYEISYDLEDAYCQIDYEIEVIKAEEKQVRFIPRPTDESSIYIALQWNADVFHRFSDYDLCLFNTSMDECVRGPFSVDSDNNKLLNDSEDDDGIEIIEVNNLIDRDYNVYALDSGFVYDAPENNLIKRINSFYYIPNSGNILTIKPNTTEKSYLWSPGYITNGVFVEDQHIYESSELPSWTKVNKTHVFHENNLPDGYFLKENDSFIRLYEYDNPRNVKKADSFKGVIYCEKDLFSKESFLVLKKDSVIAVRNMPYKSISITRFHKTGYVYDADFDDRYDIHYPLFGSQGTIDYSDIKAINDIDFDDRDAIDDYFDDVITSEKNLYNYNGLLVGDESILGDSIKVKYIDGTEIKNQFFSVKYWCAIDYDNFSGYLDYEGTMMYQETENGYFELRFPEGLESGLYKIILPYEEFKRSGIGYNSPGLTLFFWLE